MALLGSRSAPQDTRHAEIFIDIGPVDALTITKELWSAPRFSRHRSCVIAGHGTPLEKGNREPSEERRGCSPRATLAAAG